MTDTILSPVTETLLLLFGLVVVIYGIRKIVLLYQSRKRLPPGPFPWPVIGNLLLFKGNRFGHDIFTEIGSKYGPVFALFMSHMPSVIITDPEIGIQVLKKHTFAGRPKIFADNLFFKKGSTDIVMADFGKEWEALRKVGHSAARKFAVSPQLSPMVTDTVDRVIVGFGDSPSDSNDMVSILMIAILAQAAFGRKFEFDDPEFIRWKGAFDGGRKLNTFLILTMVLPFLKYVCRWKWNELMSHIHYQREYIEKMYKMNEDNYYDGKNESFCDAIITAKKEAEGTENWMEPHLKHQNLLNTVSDLFAAGTDTTRLSLRWIFLMMAKHPDLQERMRKDMDDAIGVVEPTIEDKDKLPLVCAFISETMRFRPIAPGGVPHKATVDEEVNGHTIPKGTTVMVMLTNALWDEKVWGDPLVFRPDRFLGADGKYVSKPNNFFIPFSDGRRSCPGNKLAFNNLFLIVTRFLQKTRDIQVVGGVTEEHLKGDLSITSGFEPIPYSLQFVLRE